MGLLYFVIGIGNSFIILWWVLGWIGFEVVEVVVVVLVVVGVVVGGIGFVFVGLGNVVIIGKLLLLFNWVGVSLSLVLIVGLVFVFLVSDIVE